MTTQPVTLLVLSLLSLMAVAEEGDLYLFHNLYTNHFEGNGYYLREQGDSHYEEDNNTTGLRYELSDNLALGAGYTPRNSYNESSVIAAAEYAWGVNPYLDLGGIAGLASGYELAEKNSNGWAIQVGPMARANIGMFSLTGLVINMKIFALNAEIRLGNF